MDNLNFEVSKEDGDLINVIARRAQKEIFAPAGIDRDVMTIAMDLRLAHNNAPLRLKEFSEAKGYDFAHDVGGIFRHLNRETGKLEGCFLPRFAIQ